MHLHNETLNALGRGLTRPKLKADEISQAIARYSKYRSPEAAVRLISFEDNELRLQFEGPFCTTCGFYDYLEDFIFELKETADVSMKIDTIEESGFQTFIVRYVIEE